MVSHKENIFAFRQVNRLNVPHGCQQNHVLIIAVSFADLKLFIILHMCGYCYLKVSCHRK